MTDRELLELAAKAAGKKIIDWCRDRNGVLVALLDDESYWQPLIENALTDCMGDALRLAVECGIEYRRITMPHSIGIQAYDGSIMAVYEQYGDDHYAATRRAVLRAAAEIGRDM